MLVSAGIREALVHAGIREALAQAVELHRNPHFSERNDSHGTTRRFTDELGLAHKIGPGTS